jgi:hypothetical protein
MRASRVRIRVQPSPHLFVIVIRQVGHLVALDAPSHAVEPEDVRLLEEALVAAEAPVAQPLAVIPDMQGVACHIRMGSHTILGWSRVSYQGWGGVADSLDEVQRLADRADAPVHELLDELRGDLVVLDDGAVVEDEHHHHLALQLLA